MPKLPKKLPSKKSPAKLVSFNRAPHSKVIRIEKTEAEKMHFRSPRREKAAAYRAAELVKKVVAQFGSDSAGKTPKS